jgi:hypothetical protein
VAEVNTRSPGTRLRRGLRLGRFGATGYAGIGDGNNPEGSRCGLSIFALPPDTDPRAGVE